MWKAVCQWDDTQTFKNWDARRQGRIYLWKRRLKEMPEDFWEWLKNLSRLKKLYFVLASIVVSIFFYSFWFIFPEFINKIDDGKTSFYNLSLAVFAILSGIGAVFGFYTSIIRTETQEQGLITDRINKATEGLGKNDENGKPIIEVRLGALYSLERIAQDSIRDHMQIIKILCAYARHNGGLQDKAEKPREDVIAAVTIIGQRDRWPNGRRLIRREASEAYHLDLRDCDLRNINIYKANLSNALLNGVDLRGAVLRAINLQNANLHNADLRGAELTFGNLKSARFQNANLSDAKFGRANLESAGFNDATMIKADFSHANMTKASFVNTNMSNASCSLAKFNWAWFEKVNMTGAMLDNSDFTGASFVYGNMDNARLMNTKFNKANLNGISLNGTDFGVADMMDVCFNYHPLTCESYAYTGNFSKCLNLTQAQLEEVFFGIKVTIPNGLIRPDHWPKNDISFDEFVKALKEMRQNRETQKQLQIKNGTYNVHTR